MTQTRQLHLGAFMRPVSIHSAWWRYPGAQSDANFSFDDLQYLLQKLGFEIRKTKGSHLIAQKGMSFHNLQEKKGNAKPYQVAQVRDDLKKFNIKPE